MSSESLAKTYRQRNYANLEDIDSITLQLYLYLAVFGVVAVLSNFQLYSPPDTLSIVLVVAAFVPALQWCFREWATEWFSLSSSAATTILVIAGPLQAVAVALTDSVSYARGALVLGCFMALFMTLKKVPEHDPNHPLDWIMTFVYTPLVVLVWGMAPALLLAQAVVVSTQIPAVPVLTIVFFSPAVLTVLWEAYKVHST